MAGWIPLFSLPSGSHWHWLCPQAFWLLLLLPVFWFLYRRAVIAQWKRLYRFSPAALLEHALDNHGSGWKRWFEPLWISLVLVLMVVSLARPIATWQHPVSKVNIMLVMDISLSMMARDIEPSRIEAAKEAAIDFIENLPDDVNVGLELFAGNNYVVQSPQAVAATSEGERADHGMILAYLKSLSERHLQMRTEIGSALKTAVDILSTNNPQKKTQQLIVLLSDGDSQEGYPWNIAVARAREQRITIDTIGIGSNHPASITYQGQEYPVSFSENTLRQIADTAGGHYFRVLTRNDFRTIYDQLKERSLVMTERKEELTSAFVLITFLVMMAGMALLTFQIRKT